MGTKTTAFLLMFCMILLGCGSEDPMENTLLQVDNNSSQPQILEFSALVDGQLFIVDLNSPDTRANWVPGQRGSFRGSNAEETLGIEVFLDESDQVGEYLLGGSATSTSQVSIVNEGYYWTSSDDSFGMLKVVSNDGKLITGTFSFTAVKQTENINLENETVKVTDGKFRMTVN